MSTGAHTIASPHGASRTKKRLGRGNASQKGTYAGRGIKGQRARSGGKAGGKLRGLKQAIQKVPKRRGFVSMHPQAQTVTLRTLERVGDEAITITPSFLKEKHVIKHMSQPIKIVSHGSLTKKLTITGCLATKQAVIAIEQAGGTLSF